MYIEKVCQLGSDTIEIQRYAFGMFGAPGKERRPKSAKQTEADKKKNRKNRARLIQRLMLCNFKQGDLHVILQYRKEDRPKTFREGVERLRAFIRRIRKYYRERGFELKYIAVTERGKRRAVLHHHIILETIDENTLHTLPAITACWDGYVKTSVMYEEGNFEKLAEYLTKEEGKEECGGASYMRSRNLKEPVVERRVVFKKTWEKEPEAPEGWHIDKESLINGTNGYTGKPYQRYFMKRIKPESRINIKHAAPPEDKKLLFVRLPRQKKREKRINIKNTGFFEKIKQAAGRIFR